MKTCAKCGATMVPKDANKFVCEYCGNVIQIEKELPKEECILQQQPVTQREVIYVKDETDKSKAKLGCWMWGFCLLIPLLGLIMFFVYKSKNENDKATSAITAAIIGFILAVILEAGGFWDGFWAGFYGY